MKFSEEYKSAMNEIAPDEKAAERIERAVMNRIAEKPAKSKRKTPIFIGGFGSGCLRGDCVRCGFQGEQLFGRLFEQRDLHRFKDVFAEL